MIYYFHLNEDLNYEKILSKAPSMPIERYNRFLKYIKKEDKLKCLIAYLIIEMKLKEKNFDIKFDYSKNGKPSHEFINFSISHTNDFIVVSFDDDLVGVDIEIIEHCSEGVLLNMFGDNHADFKDLSKDTLTKFWTIKESFFKYCDGSEQIDLKKIENIAKDTIKYKDIYFISFILGNSVLTSCSKKKNISINEIRIEQLEG